MLPTDRMQPGNIDGLFENMDPAMANFTADQIETGHP